MLQIETNFRIYFIIVIKYLHIILCINDMLIACNMIVVIVSKKKSTFFVNFFLDIKGKKYIYIRGIYLV